MRANWAVLTANGERPKPTAPTQAAAGPALRRSHRKRSAVVPATPSREGEAGGREGVADEAQAARDDPGLGEGAGVEAVGDARLAGGEQALRREDLVELVRVWRPVEVDGIDERRRDEHEQGCRPGGQGTAGHGRGDGGCGQGSAHRAQRENGPRDGAGAFLAERPRRRTAP